MGWTGWLVVAALAAVFAWACAGAGLAPRTEEGAFLADRRWPWWKAALALAAADVSVLTLLALPAGAFQEGWVYARFFAAGLAGRAICWRLLPALRSGAPTTVYGRVRARLGPAAGRLAGLTFCAGRGAASALRLAVAATALAALTGAPAAAWVILLCAGCAAYVGRGGLRAVARAAVVQCAVLGASVVAVFLYTMRHTPGALHGPLRVAAEGGRLAFFEGGGFWRACLLGFMGALAAFTADHELAQKLLACRSDADARRALAGATALSAALLIGLLATGTWLYAYYRAHPALAVPARLDDILLHFSTTVLPGSLRGLLTAAVLITAANLPLSSLSAVTWSDVGAGKCETGAAARRGLAWGWAAALGAAAFLLLRKPDLASSFTAAWPGALWPLAAAVLASI
jgi:solute:Na+ symporter, SSS family